MSINKIYNIQEYKTIGTGSTPSSGNQILYPKTDGNWYHMGSDGIEKLISLSYQVGNGLTVSSASSSYDYKLSVAIDNSSLTYSNGVLKVGYITASNLSQNGGGTAGYVLSVDSAGIPTWVPYTSQGISGTLNYISKFDSSSSLTNSTIYDDGNSVVIGATLSSQILGVYPKLAVRGDVDIANKLYFTSSSSIYLTGLSSTKLGIITDGLTIKNSTYNYIDITPITNAGSYISLLGDLVRLTTTGSNNATASLIMPTIKLVGIGTASPTHLLHIFSTQSAFRLVDGSQGVGKFLTSDSNGIASWASVTPVLGTYSGLTSTEGLSINLKPNSGLTISSAGLDINPSAAGYGLFYSGGSFSVNGNFGIVINNGLTNSGTTYSVNLGVNSGLTFSGLGPANSIIINLGTGLTISNGRLVPTVVNLIGLTNSFPYYNSSSSLTSSEIYQIGNNILIGTSSNIGAKLYVNGTFSFVKDGIINGAFIGRGNGLTNLLFGNLALSNATVGNYNIGIGDNALYANSVGSDYNIAIGTNALYSMGNSFPYGTASIGIGYDVLRNSNSSNIVAIGMNAGYNSGKESVYLGAYAGNGGTGNIAVGFMSGGYSVATTNSFNVFIGYKSGTNFGGSYSVFIGGYDLATASSNNVFISDGQGNLRIYSPSNGNILIGTMSDNGYKLQIAGSVSIIGSTKIVDGNQGLGKFLVSDSNGLSSWYMPVGLGMTISGYTFSILPRTNSGLTVSTSGLGIVTGFGLTISSNSVVLDPNIASFGLTYSAGTIFINPSLAGYGLTYSNGSMSFTTNINAQQGYIPYFSTITSLTSSVIYQTSSNILIGTVSNNGARLQIAGSMSVISATGNAFRLVDGSQASNRVLKSDSNGFATWAAYKYSGTQSFSANIGSMVSHNLNTNFYLIQLFDYTTGEEIMGSYTSRGLTQTIITLTSDVSNCGVVIIG